MDAAPSKELLLENVKSFLTSGDYSDLTISCKPHTYKVHKIVVCSRAGFFRKAVGFGGQETHENKISLDEDEPEIVKLLLQYLYEGEYDPLSSTLSQDNHSAMGHTCRPSDDWNVRCREVLCAHHQCGRNCGDIFNNSCSNFTCSTCVAPLLQGGAQQLLTHSQMYECADKYDVAGLKELAKKKFEMACKSFWRDALFAVAATHAFTTTPDNDMGLRNIVIQTIKNRLELIDKPEIQDLLERFNGLAFGILKQGKAEGWK